MNNIKEYEVQYQSLSSNESWNVYDTAYYDLDIACEVARRIKEHCPKNKVRIVVKQIIKYMYCGKDFM